MRTRPVEPITAFRAKPIETIRLVASRELNTRLRTRSFLIGTAVILAAIIGFITLQATLIGSAQNSTIGLSGQATSIAEPLKKQASQLGVEIETKPVAAPEDGRGLVNSGEIDALVSGSVADLNVVVESGLDQEIRAMLTTISQSEVLKANLAELGADPAAVMADVNDTALDVTVLQPPDPQKTQREVIGMIIVVLMFFGIMTYGSLVTQGIVEEKSSRVVEILLSTVRPWQLMLGKVLGLGLVGLVQLAIIGVVGIIAASATGILTVSGAATGMLAWGLLWYVLGFFMYATIFAAAGSLVSRQEEVQSVVTPVTMVLVVGYVVGFNLILQDPEGSTTTALSLIPLFSPIMMPGRIAVGVAPVWQIGLTILLTIGAIALFTWIGSRIYRNAVLHTGARVKLTEALRT